MENSGALSASSNEKELETSQKRPGIPDVDVNLLDVNGSPFILFNYFIKTDDKNRVKCNMCQDETFVSRVGGNSTGMSNHLNRYHKEVVEKFKEQKAFIDHKRSERKAEKSTSQGGDGFKQIALVSDKNKKLSLCIPQIDSKMQERFDLAVTLFLSKNYISFQAMEDLDLITHAIWPNSAPKVKVKSRKVVASNVSKTAGKLLNEIQSIIDALKKSSFSWAFTSDIWSSPNHSSFLSLTLHVVTEDFILLKLVPFIEIFDVKHTGKNIRLKLDDYLEQLGLSSDEFRKTIVMDNASNNVLAIKLTQLFDAWMCSIHTLQLAINDLLKVQIRNVSIQDVLDKCREIARKVRKSSQSKTQLQDACTSLGMQFIWPNIPNATRWNSTAKNLADILRLKPALQYIDSHDDSGMWSSLSLSAAEWKAAKCLGDILEIPKKVTKLWESETKPTLHLVVKELYNMVSELENFTTEGNEYFIQEFALELIQNVNQRFPNFGTNHMIANIAHYLDPLCRGVVLMEFPDMYEKTKDEIRKLGVKCQSQKNDDGIRCEDEDITQSIDVELNKMSATERLLKKRKLNFGGNENASLYSQINQELSAYEALNEEINVDILQWYKDHHKTFPILSQVAREVLCVPASSASSERAFSVSGQVLVHFLKCII